MRDKPQGGIRGDRVSPLSFDKKQNSDFAILSKLKITKSQYTKIVISRFLYIFVTETKHCDMKIISIINHKGGVGKTTTAVNLSVGLARLGKKVLVIDLDAQTNLTYNLGFDTEGKTIYNAMRGEINSLPIYSTTIKNLSIVPAHLNLGMVEMEIYQKKGNEYILRRLIDEQRPRYDYIVIDCPPSISLLTFNALIASTDVIIPIEADGFALHGIVKLGSVIEQIKSNINTQLKILGLLITKFDKRKTLSREVENILQLSPQYNILKPAIRVNVSLSEASLNRQDVFSYAPKSTGAEDYLELTQNIIDYE